MPYIKEICKAGKTIEITKRFSARFNKKGITRGQNKKPTPELMQAINEKNAETKLRRLINTNYRDGDLHITITYANNKIILPEEAKKEVEKFLRRLRVEYRKHEEELKYILVTEYKNKRIHHHIIVNSIENETEKIFKRLWKKGRIRFTYLDNTGQYSALAHYLIKETRKTFREKDSPSKKRWNASKNLKKPVIKKEIIKAREWRKIPEPIKGYSIEADSIQEGFHDFTGWPFQVYRMIKTGKTENQAERAREEKQWII
ncbi:hypothetical protein Q5O24_11900 [Eubacteriaceae bacterium ES3]|nr:hypothetical protein Q5O24_11900 [Eubacteriaceae bacterium ES3]